jgi:hypothetical protein
MPAKKKAAKEKPLDKMTAKELRDAGKALGTIPAVFSMNKAELLAAIKAAKGIVDESPQGNDSSVREIKAKIRELKNMRASVEDPAKATILRRKISRLKKKSRNAA